MLFHWTQWSCPIFSTWNSANLNFGIDWLELAFVAIPEVELIWACIQRHQPNLPVVLWPRQCFPINHFWVGTYQLTSAPMLGDNKVQKMQTNPQNTISMQSPYSRRILILLHQLVHSTGLIYLTVRHLIWLIHCSHFYFLKFWLHVTFEPISKPHQYHLIVES